MASFPSSWIITKAKAPQAPPSPTSTPTRPTSLAATAAAATAPAKPKPHATLFTFTRPPPPPSPSPTPTRHLSSALLAKPTPHRADGPFSFSRRYDSPPSSPSARSRCESLAFSCRDSAHFLRDMGDAILPNGPCGRPGCCGDELHPSSFLCFDCLYHDDDGIEGEGGVPLGRAAKPLPRQSPFTGLGQDAPAVFPSSWIVRSTSVSTSTPTPVLARSHAMPHALGEKARSWPPAFMSSASMPSAMAPSNPSPLRSTESISKVSPPPPSNAHNAHPDAPAKTAVRRHTHLGSVLGSGSGSGSASQIAAASDSSHIGDEYLWELKGRPTQRELIDCWLRSTPGMEPRKRVKRSHWFNNGSDASGDADEPHLRLPVSDAYSVYSTSTQNTTRPSQ
ncbi:hypothetical protein EDB81DRAFT_54238 [Dactylonectria macrodidyma]|uniref:Uncharacterized protein n=1 Tax=Dactylonectria macrodidyma TaxID=307937 RepID=A0A9P9J4R6_9HYPO|nr:hypothetical protein EDB81DRAFT_54238 [Dactylonectria macrodidyma]